MNLTNDREANQDQQFNSQFSPHPHYNNVYSFPSAEYFHSIGVPASQYNHIQHFPSMPSQRTSDPHTPSSGTRSDSSQSPVESNSSRKKACIPVPEDKKDKNYWDKRQKNNESARRSRVQKKVRANKVSEEITKIKLEIAQYEHSIMLARQEHEYFTKEYHRLYAMLYSRTV